jgi:hypothetical protein
MLSCACGRRFNSEGAIAQHKAAKTRLGRASACEASVPEARIVAPKRDRREAWMWKNVDIREPFQTMDYATLEPSNSPVSSTSPSELICSYNWQNTSTAEIRIPG